MPKQKIVQKRITPKILVKLYPQPVVDKIIELANEYGNEGEMEIKSLISQTIDVNYVQHTREGDKYVVMDPDGKEVSVQMVSQDTVGASDVSNELNPKFQIPAGTFMISITYYKKHIMKVYTCVDAEKLGPVNEELVTKLDGDLRLTGGINKSMEKREEKSENAVSDLEKWDRIIRPVKKLELPATVNKDSIEEAGKSAKELLDTIIEAESEAYAENLTKDRSAQLPNNPSQPDAVLVLPKLDSETGEVSQAVIEQLPEERDPKVLQPRKRRTEPLEIQPIAPTTAMSDLKAKSPDGVNLYHGEVVVVGIGENENKEFMATMKIGGRKWICLSGGWDYEISTGNMKEILNVYHTNFSRVNGNWKNNKDGNGWKIREDWFKKIIETN